MPSIRYGGGMVGGLKAETPITTGDPADSYPTSCRNVNPGDGLVTQRHAVTCWPALYVNVK